MEADWVQEKLHPGDLKPSLAKAINKILQPIRDHFATNPEAREILSLVRSFRVRYPKKVMESRVPYSVSLYILHIHLKITHYLITTFPTKMITHTLF